MSSFVEEVMVPQLSVVSLCSLTLETGPTALMVRRMSSWLFNFIASWSVMLRIDPFISKYEKINHRI